MIKTDRLWLRPWREADRDPFATMNAHSEVMHDLGGPIGRAASDAKFDRYVAAFNRHGVCRWVIEDRAGDFLGYAGVMPAGPDHPLGRHFEIGCDWSEAPGATDTPPRRHKARSTMHSRAPVYRKS